MATRAGAELERWCIVLVVVEHDGSLVRIQRRIASCMPTAPAATRPSAWATADGTRFQWLSPTSEIQTACRAHREQG